MVAALHHNFCTCAKIRYVNDIDSDEVCSLPRSASFVVDVSSFCLLATMEQFQIFLKKVISRNIIVIYHYSRRTTGFVYTLLVMRPKKWARGL